MWVKLQPAPQMDISFKPLVLIQCVLEGCVADSAQIYVYFFYRGFTLTTLFWDSHTNVQYAWYLGSVPNQMFN